MPIPHAYEYPWQIEIDFVDLIYLRLIVAGVPQPLREHDESYWRKKFREITNKKLYLPLRMVFIVFFFGIATQLAAMRPFMVGVLIQFGLTVDNYLVLVSLSGTPVLQLHTNKLKMPCDKAPDIKTNNQSMFPSKKSRNEKILKNDGYRVVYFESNNCDTYDCNHFQFRMELWNWENNLYLSTLLSQEAQKCEFLGYEWIADLSMWLS